MANPAKLLHEQLTTWRSSYPDNFAPADDHRIAVRHLDSIHELLGQMDLAEKRTAIFRKHFPAWEHLTLHHPHAWHTQDHLKPLDENALEHLDHLSDRLDDLTPELSEEAVDEIRQYVDAVADLLRDDDSIHADLKLHARQVVAHLRWCLDNYAAVGDFSLREAVDQLVAVVLKTTAGSSSPERWKKFLAKWLNLGVYPFAVGTAANIAAVPGQVLLQHALGSGG